MTKYLPCNYAMWDKQSNFRTTFSGGIGNIEFMHDFVFQGAIPTFGNVLNLTQMPLDGDLIGIIVHVRDSNSNGEAEFVPVTGTSTENPFVQTGHTTHSSMQILIPALATGFFFSDPNATPIPFLKNDWVGLKRRKNFGSDFPGITQVSVMYAIELKTT